MNFDDKESYDTIRQNDIKIDVIVPHVPPILSISNDFEELDTDFIHGLLDRYLYRWRQNPLNKGFKPFVSIKIFQYDPNRMKKTSRDFKTENSSVIVRKKKIKQKIKKKKHSRKTHQWIGEEKEDIEVVETVEHIEKEVLADESVHCHIENYEEMPLIPVYMINKQSNLITNNNIALFPEIKPLIDQFPDCTVISKQDNEYIERSAFDVESAIETMESSIPIMIKHNVSKRVFVDPITIDKQGDKVIINAPIQSALTPLEECIGPEKINGTIIEFLMLRSLIRDIINPNMSIDTNSKNKLNDMITKIHDILMTTMSYQIVHYSQIKGREIEIYDDKPINFIRSTMNGGYL